MLTLTLTLTAHPHPDPRPNPNPHPDPNPSPGPNPNQVRAELGELGIVLKKDEYKLDPKPLVKLVMSRFFGEP